MGKYAQIRPYHDEEVRPVLDRLIVDKEFISTIARLRAPLLSRWFPGVFNFFITRVLRRQFAGVNNVFDFQLLIERYLDRLMETATSGLTHSGIDHLQPSEPYLFISNHRDIAMDPALISYTLHTQQFETVRIAIGDNLLTKPFASDLMRLNKSFIVPRSAKGREMLTAYRLLSSYIRHSIVVDRSSIWLAQREGRAKDGRDKTEPAILKMLSMSMNKKTESLSEHIHHLNIVPVSVSYEFDPCDGSKAKELHAVDTQGKYLKSEHEDVTNIGLGIAGFKGCVHVSFGQPLKGEWPDVDAIAAEIDDVIYRNYVLHPTNFFAYKQLYGQYPDLPCGAKNESFEEGRFAESKRLFEERMAAIDESHRSYAMNMYANPVLSKLNASDQAQSK